VTVKAPLIEAIEALEKKYDRPYIEIIRRLAKDGHRVDTAAEFLKLPRFAFSQSLKKRGWHCWFDAAEEKHRKEIKARIPRLDQQKFLYRGLYDTLPMHAKRFDLDPTLVKRRYRRTRDLDYALGKKKKEMTIAQYFALYERQLLIEKRAGMGFGAAIQKLAYAGYSVDQVADAFGYSRLYFRKLCREEGYIQWFRDPHTLELERNRIRRAKKCRITLTGKPKRTTIEDPRRYRLTSSWLKQTHTV
jgi:AraC-like DNA-binding protein